MKKNKKGFTLIELLTVIAIIGILAGIIIPSVGAVRNSAKKAKTQSMFSQWAVAMEQFRQDYGYYPDPGSLGFPGADESSEFYRLLTGDDASTLNTKRIRYYSFSEDAFGRDDDGYAANDDKIVDAYGNHNIVMGVDSDRNGLISTSEASGIPIPSGGLRSSVIFYSQENTDPKIDSPEVQSW